VNNVETLAAAATILSRDDAKAETKLFSLSGAVRRPGVFELRLGTPVRTLIEGCGGGVAPDAQGRPREVKAFFTAGYAAGFLPGSGLDLPLSFDALQKAGAALGCASFIVVPTGECIVSVVEETLRFFAHESCGKCTPCRVGTEKMAHMVGAWRSPDFGRTGRGADDMAALEELAPAIVDASICGLGQFAPKPYQDALRHFREEVEAHARGDCVEGTCFRESAP
jgi:NADH:ubiquinone oxidoreductase subunit F (NADH-binding)